MPMIRMLKPRQSQLIWWQFARYESELGYLRSVIASYEDRPCASYVACSWYDRPLVS